MSTTIPCREASSVPSLPASWYHGSGARFDRFELGCSKSVQEDESQKHWNSHLGIHFSSSRVVANEFAVRQRGFLYAATLEMLNPAYYSSEYDLDRHAAEWAMSAGYDIGLKSEYMANTQPDEWMFYLSYSDVWNTCRRPELRKISLGFRDHLIAQGYDGILYGNEFEQASSGFGTHTESRLCAITFLPEQIHIISCTRSQST